MAPRRVVIVGGGITGLTLAYRLLTASREGKTQGGQPLAVTLVEERTRLGGNVQTERRDGFVIDGGPDAWVAAKPQATALCRELGLGDRLIGTTEQNRKVYMHRHGALHPLPEGVVLTIPTRVLPLARTRLLSWPGKARMALDLVLPRRRDEGDESIAGFVRRRLGREALQGFAEPLLGGIYAGDVEALSIQSTFPQLVELERKYGSLIRGALAQQKAHKAKAGPGPRGPASLFHSLLGGTGELVEAVARREPTEAEPARFALTIAGQAEPLLADELVLATPAFAAADALSGVDLELAAALRRVPYLSTATVALAYARTEIPHPLDAVGIIIPRVEGRKVLAATFVSSKWMGRAPSDSVLLRVFAGGHRDPEALQRSDDELVTLGREELAALLGVRARPRFARVFRFARANAQPVVGHAENLRALRQRAERYPGLYFAGAAFDGVGIGDCVRQANEVAAAIAGAG